MRASRSLLVGIALAAAVIVALLVLVGTRRHAHRRSGEPAVPTPVPFPPGAPSADTGLEELQELGLLDDTPATAGEPAVTGTATASPSSPPPATDTGLQELQELGLLNDTPATAREPVMGETVAEAAAASEPALAPFATPGELGPDEDSHAAEEVSRALLEEVTEAVAGVSPAAREGTGAAPGDEVTLAVEIELEVAEFAAKADEPAQDVMSVEVEPDLEPSALTEAPPSPVNIRVAEDASEPEPAPTEQPVAPPPPGPALAPALLARAEALLDEGNAYFNVGQYAMAVQRYDEALDIDGALVAALYNRANARTRLGDYDSALVDYDAALELNPRDIDALNNRGMLHLHRGDIPAALADLNAALAIDPHDTTVVVNRGLVYLQSGDARRAFDDFSEAARVDPRDAAAHYGAAQASALLGDSVAALNSLRNAFRLESSYVREAAADPHFVSLQQNPDYTRLLRESGR